MSGCLVCWSLRRAEFDFEVRYKLGKANQQVDALSQLRTEAETVKSNDDDDILVFIIDDTVDNPPTDSIEPDLMDPDYLSLDEFYATQEAPNSNDTAFTPIELEDLASRQMHDRFGTEICPRLNEGEVLAFEINDDGLSI